MTCRFLGLIDLGLDVFDHGIEVYPTQEEDISLSGLFDKGVKVTA